MRLYLLSPTSSRFVILAVTLFVHRGNNHTGVGGYAVIPVSHGTVEPCMSFALYHYRKL